MQLVSKVVRDLPKIAVERIGARER